MDVDDRGRVDRDRFVVRSRIDDEGRRRSSIDAEGGIDRGEGVGADRRGLHARRDGIAVHDRAVREGVGVEPIVVGEQQDGDRRREDDIVAVAAGVADREGLGAADEDDGPFRVGDERADDGVGAVVVDEGELLSDGRCERGAEVQQRAIESDGAGDRLLFFE